MDEREHVLRSPFPGLLGNGAQLRQRAAPGTGNVRDVADRENAVEPGHHEVGSDIDPSAAARCRAGGGGDLRRGFTAAPDHRPGRKDRPVGQLHRFRIDAGDSDAERELDPVVLQFRQRVLVGLLGKRLQQRVAVVDQVHARRVRKTAGLLQCGEQFCDCSRGLHPGGTTADDDDGERFRGCLRRALHPQQFVQVQPQPLGVDDRIQRERVLIGAGDAEEIGSGSLPRAPGTRRRERSRRPWSPDGGRNRWRSPGSGRRRRSSVRRRRRSAGGRRPRQGAVRSRPDRAGVGTADSRSGRSAAPRRLCDPVRRRRRPRPFPRPPRQPRSTVPLPPGPCHPSAPDARPQNASRPESAFPERLCPPS